MIRFSIYHSLNIFSLDMTRLAYHIIYTVFFNVHTRLRNSRQISKTKTIPIPVESCPKPRQQFNNIIIADARECSINSNESRYTINRGAKSGAFRDVPLHHEGVISVYAPLAWTNGRARCNQ